jgi:NADPH-dependent 2,4-dienoyl-CoA reductase/sulfur reductase-like enzyme
MNKELIIIGGGPAGLAAAREAFDQGIRDILIIERDRQLGGILNQCIHNGFGLHRFKEELTGPEYAAKYIELLRQTCVEVKSDTMVIHLTEDKQVHCVSAEGGYEIFTAKAVILAMGCRERTRGAISIPGSRACGVFTAGAAQRYLNIDGYLVGKRVVILGSGDIGLIMARRMTLEGAKVLAVVELMPYSNGLNRNIVQCLEDFQIPLYLSHTVTNVIGKGRIRQVVVSKVDENKAPIPGTEITFDCDTLLLSVGLIPENELSREAGIQLDRRTNGPVVYENMETSLPGVFACGNVLHVHDLVDYVSMEAAAAGKAAAEYLRGNMPQGESLSICNGPGIGYTVPQRVHPDTEDFEISFRVTAPMENKQIVLRCGDRVIASAKRSKLLPAEMEKLKVKKEQLTGLTGELLLTVGDAP